MQTTTEQQALIRQLNVIDDVFFHKIAEDKDVCEEISKLSDRVCYFKEAKEGADAIMAMTQDVEEYFKKRISEQLSEHDKETAKSLIQNGVSVELVKKSIPTLSVEFIETLSQQLAAVEQ